MRTLGPRQRPSGKNEEMPPWIQVACVVILGMVVAQVSFWALRTRRKGSGLSQKFANNAFNRASMTITPRSFDRIPQSEEWEHR